MAMVMDTNYENKEEGVIELSHIVRAEAESLFSFIEEFLLNLPKKKSKKCTQTILMPFEELKTNLYDTLFALKKIHELFNAEVINKLK